MGGETILFLLVMPERLPKKLDRSRQHNQLFFLSYNLVVFSNYKHRFFSFSAAYPVFPSSWTFCSMHLTAYSYVLLPLHREGERGLTQQSARVWDCPPQEGPPLLIHIRCYVGLLWCVQYSIMFLERKASSIINITIIVIIADTINLVFYFAKTRIVSKLRPISRQI